MNMARKHAGNDEAKESAKNDDSSSSSSSSIEVEATRTTRENPTTKEAPHLTRRKATAAVMAPR